MTITTLRPETIDVDREIDLSELFVVSQLSQWTVPGAEWVRRVEAGFQSWQAAIRADRGEMS